MIHINNTLNLLGLKDCQVKKILIDESEKEIHIYITLRKDEVKCPYCNNLTSVVQDYREKIIPYNFYSGKQSFIYYNRRRYKCKICNKCFFEKNPFCNFHKNISDLTSINVLNELKQNQSFKSVAAKCGISIQQVIKIFDDHVDMSRLTLSEILGIDEFKNVSSGKGKYACILVSISNHDIVDVLEDRTIDTLSSYFSKISREERQKVKFFVSDMYDGYKNIHDSYFPNSIHIIDTFHFVRLITDAFNRIRIRIMKTYDVDSFQYQLLKDYWKTLLIPYYKIDKEKILFYKRFNQHLTQKDLLNKILGINDELYHAYLLKEDFVSNYYSVYIDSASTFIESQAKRFLDSDYKEYKTVAFSLYKWKQEIVNSFYRDKKGKRNTNAMTEGFNNSIKTIKKTSYGYANFKRFRNRILYILRKQKAFKI